MIKKLLLLVCFLTSVTSAFSQNFEKNNTSGKYSLSDQISLYPNPAADKVRVSNRSEGNLKATVYNILGDPVLSKVIQKNGEDIDISKLQSGVYIVSLTDEKNIITKRLVKN